MNYIQKGISNRSHLKAVAVFALLAAWVSVPLLMNSVKADSTPIILVRTAVLAAPSGSVDPHGDAKFELYQSGNRELEIEILPDGSMEFLTVVNGNPQNEGPTTREQVPGLARWLRDEPEQTTTGGRALFISYLNKT